MWQRSSPWGVPQKLRYAVLWEDKGRRVQCALQRASTVGLCCGDGFVAEDCGDISHLSELWRGTGDQRSLRKKETHSLL